ncbi:zinc finger protein 202 isoform X2 [Scleropages formosus]|nr:zinc finger protein 202-like isoform X2 [Scleropages formosus]
MLLESAAKDQENQRLRLKLNSQHFDCKDTGNSSAHSDNEEKPTSEETKPPLKAKNFENALDMDAYRLQQKKQVVDQLKTVMEQVLKFAVSELTKIVENSFDDLVLELLKKEKENKTLNESLAKEDKTHEQCDNRRAKFPESHSTSLSSVSQKKEACQEPQSNQENGSEVTHEVTGKHSVLSVAQNWVPILDKVFDQKWCSDLWQIKETPPKIPNPDCFVHEDPDSHSIIEQETTSGEKDVGQSPWLQLDQTVEESVSANSQGTLVISTTGSSTMPVHPSTATEHSHHSPGDDVQLKSQSMLHRLLTLPSQGLSELLCSNSDISLQTFPTLADTSVTQEFLGDGELPTKNHSSPLGKKEEGVLENVELRGSVEKKSYSCKHCGRKFNQQPMMKVHQQTHGSSVVCCSLCGKRFSQPERLQTHLQAHTAKQT